MSPSEFFTVDELRSFGFREVGRSVRLSRKCSLYSINGTIGDFSRVDDFCILKGQINIGRHVHIGAFSLLGGSRGMIHLADFATLSARVSIFTGSDDYRASSLSSVTVPEEFLTTITGNVRLEQAALIGAHSVLLPGVHIGEAASVGTLCVVTGHIPAGSVVVAAGRKFTVTGRRDINRIREMVAALAKREGQERPD